MTVCSKAVCEGILQYEATKAHLHFQEDVVYLHHKHAKSRQNALGLQDHNLFY